MKIANYIKKIKFLILGLITFILTATSCTTVKPYQKSMLNHPDMSLSVSETERITNLFQSYREGASGASSGKTGGGCGCN